MFRNGDRIIWSSGAPNAFSQYLNQPGKITGIQCDQFGNRTDVHYVTLDSGLQVTSSARNMVKEH